MKYEELPGRIVIFSIKLYQKLLSPILARWLKCRFYPTCSEYVILSIKKYGLRIGFKKAYRRLRRCRSDNLDSCLDFP
ncbi:MAG: membrane protein insertion efficiency factor YidD [Candidatus Ratteibacteria bacterium]